jgi:hypothetical protein
MTPLGLSGSVAAVALSASNLRPAVGEPVRLWAAWAGEWPADIAWSGVDSDEGIEARVVPKHPGALPISAGGATLVLQVQPAANGPVPVTAPLALPRYDVDAEHCRDARYPALAGAWVLGCSGSGRVDHAVHLGTREAVALSEGAVTPGLGAGVVLAATRGLWRLPDVHPVPDLPRTAAEPIGPPATDGTHAVLAYADHIEAFTLAEPLRIHTAATPLPWYAAAIAWPWSAWVEDGGITGEDVWMRTPKGDRVPLARGARRERHVTGDGTWLAWLDEAGVYVQDMSRGERRAYPADTGFSGGLGLWGPVACWEDRAALRAGTGDVDLRCSDGMEVHRPGQQLAPSRWGPWLLFREAGRVMVATAAEIVLDDDDPRAGAGGTTVAGGYRGAHRDAPVTWTLDWPADGWRVERWADGAWVSGERVAVGLVTLQNPSGDAVRLRPADGAAP